MSILTIARPSWRAVLAFAALSLSAVAHAANGYTYTELAPVGGNTSSRAKAINNAGQIVGESFDVQSFSGNISIRLSGVVWGGGTTTILPPVPSPYTPPGATSPLWTWPTAINRAGVVAGYGPVRLAPGPAITAQRPAVWSDGGLTELPTPGSASGVATAINDFGVAAGYSVNANNSQRPLLWSTIPVDLGTLGGATGSVRGINNLNHVVGSSDTSGGQRHATLWTGTAIIDLGTPGGGTISSASDINDRGVIVGQSQTAGNAGLRAVVWQANGSATLLDSLGGSNSTAYALNEGGLVVGRSQVAGDSAFHATLWHGKAVTDLNSFLDPGLKAAGWVLTFAHGINERGVIVGEATNAVLQQYRGFALSPFISQVPEAASQFMAFAGVGVIAGLARWRARRQAA